MPSMEAKWRWMLVTAIAPIAWGTTYYVTRHTLPADTPLWGAVIRALPAGLILLAITRERPRGSWWWKSLVLGVLNIGAFFILVYLAAQLLPSSVASTLMATSAAVLMLLAWPLLSQRPRLLAVIGAVLGFVGVCVMLLDGSGAIEPGGVIASLAAMLLSSVGFILSRRWSSGVRVLTLTSWQLIAGGLVVLPVALIVEGAPPPLEPQSLFGFAYISIVGTAIAFCAWFAGLKHLPASAVGLIGLLNPVAGVLLGTLLAGESFGLRQIVGALLVLVGMALGQQRAATTPPTPSPRPPDAAASRSAPAA